MYKNLLRRVFKPKTRGKSYGCFALFCLLFLSNSLSAQTITGVVRDVNNQPIPGVTVVIEGTAKGISTDLKGAYALNVSGENDHLVFSSIGMETVREQVGKRSTIDVVLKDEAKALEMVVVSALGFTENRDKQGTASSKVDPKSVIRSGETGILQGLAGKAAGVRITRATGDPGAGSNIQIRGANTITGASQPLIILDGIPISNTNSLGFGSSATGVGVQQQSRLNDINAADIESMQILKGAAAAALWGSRAANGVLVITTKKGKSGRVQVSYGMSYSVDEINAKHPMQNTFGQGAAGLFNPTATNSWGDKIADRSGAADSLVTTGERFVSDISGRTYYPVGRRGTAGVFVKNDKSAYVDDNFNAIFGKGSFLENSLTVSAGTERSRTFFSLTDLNQKGIIRQNSDYRRSAIRLNNDMNLGNYLKLSTKANYILTNSNRIQQNSNVSGLYLGLLRTPPDFDNADYKGTYYDASGAPNISRHRSYRRYLGSDVNPQFNNPEWTIKEQEAPNTVHRFLISSEVVMLPTDWFDITVRGGIDGHTDTRQYFFPVGSAGADRAFGSYQHESISDVETNLDIIGRAQKRLSKDVNGTLIVGYNLNDRKRKNLYGQSRNFVVNTNLKNFINAGSSSASNSTLETGSNRGYSTASFDYKNQLTVNASGALEAASTINGNFFYPSVDASWRFNKLLKDQKWLSLGKLRASWGQVGVRPSAYRFTTVYESVPYETYDDPLDPAFFGGGYRLDNSKGNGNLRPEIKTEWELGTDLRFFDNRLSFSASYYNNEIKDILLNVGRTPSSGFTSQYANAGLMTNKGWETEFNLELLKKGDFSLNLYGNANQNINKVVDLKGSITIDLTGQSMSSRAVQGYPMGELWGPRALRDANGAFVLDALGYPQVDIQQGPLGNPNPDWRGGLGLNMSYKNFDFNILFETSQGGKISQGTKSVIYNFGTHADVGNEVTLTKEMKNVAGRVYPTGSVVRGNIGNYGGGDVILDEAWYTTRGAGLGASAIREFFVGDATWTRLREASLMYNLNGERFKKITKLSSVQFGITGRNLLLWTPIVGFDPEVNQAGVGNGFGIEYFTNPSTRSVLFSLKINY